MRPQFLEVECGPDLARETSFCSDLFYCTMCRRVWQKDQGKGAIDYLIDWPKCQDKKLCPECSGVARKKKNKRKRK